MPMKTAVNWYEVYSKDVASAVKFYENVFGWTSASMPMGEMTYYTFTSGVTMFGGVMDLSHPSMTDVPPHWGLYFHSSDCAATIAKVQELGGKVVYGPMQVPGIGTMAGFNDCCGAHFNVHQPESERPDLSRSAVNWVEHMGPSRECAVGFYTSLFGWGSNDMDMGDPVGIYTMFTLDEVAIGGCMNVPSDQVPPNWTIYLHSDSLEDTLSKVTENGGSVMQPPMDIGQFGRIAIAADCCGAVFGIHQPPAM